MKLDILIGLACSPYLRDACRALGHNAWTCDLKPAEDGSSYHIRGDVRDQLSKGWHLAVLHPVCTRMTNAGVRWLHVPPPGKTKEEMWAELVEGCALFSDCLNAPIPCKATENPVMHRHAKERIRNYRPFSQSVQPWQFGTDEAGPDNVKKRTCFWLENLPNLKPTGTLDGSTARPEVHHASPGPDRAEFRSRSHPGMMQACAEQWCAAAVEFL